MTTTALEQIPSIEEHTLVVRHTRQLHELEEKLGIVQARRADLLTEQQRLRHAQHEADVAAALGDGGAGDPDRVSALADLAITISRVDTEETTLAEALQRLTAMAAESRQHAQHEHDEQVKAVARDLLATMIPLVEDAHTGTLQLAQLASRVSGMLAPHPGFLEMWLDQARKLQGQ